MKITRKGFTIVELMLAVAISAIVIFGVFGILHASNRQLEVIHARMTLQEGPREALFKMAQEIRQTAWHKIDPSGWVACEPAGMECSSAINFVVPVPTPDAASLVDANFTPKWANNIEYKLEGRQILRVSTDLTTGLTPPPRKQAILANEVTSLLFSRKAASPGLITITVAAQRELPDGRKIPEEPMQMIAQAEARNP